MKEPWQRDVHAISSNLGSLASHDRFGGAQLRLFTRGSPQLLVFVTLERERAGLDMDMCLRLDGMTMFKAISRTYTQASVELFG